MDLALIAWHFVCYIIELLFDACAQLEVVPKYQGVLRPQYRGKIIGISVGVQGQNITGQKGISRRKNAASCTVVTVSINLLKRSVSGKTMFLVGR